MTFIVRFPQNAGLKRFILAKDKLVRGDPIDVLTGYLVEQRTDFTLGQTLPLRFTRTWARHKAADQADGLCGRYWVDNFSDYAELSGNGQHVRIATVEGSYLHFALPIGSTQSFNPDHPQFTLNRHCDYLKLVNRDTRSATCFALPPAWLADHDEALGFAPLQDGRLRLSRWLDRFDNTVVFHYADEPQGQSRLTRVTHSDGIELSLVYQTQAGGNAQYLQQIVRTDSEQPQVLVRYTQDSAGCLIESDALLDYHLFYHYDSQHNLTRWADNDQTWVDYHYDDQGRCIHSIGADGYYPVWFDYHDGLTLVYDSQRRCTRYQFDTRLMKPLRITADSGATTRFDYDRDGNLLAQTLPGGQTLRFDYLAQTGLVSTFYAADGETWHYQYDEEEQLTALTDPLDRTWRRSESDDGKTTLFTAPDGSQTEFRFNQFGLLAQINNRIGQTQRQQQFHYDPRHRLIAEQDAEQRRIQFDYDRRDNLVRLRSANDAQWHYGYNPHGQVTQIDRPNDSREQQDYDRHGNLIRYTDANGVVWQLRYGAFDLLSEKIDGEGNRWRYDYDKDSLKLNQVTNPLGETYTYTFNTDGLVETETDFADNRWTFRYDENGNLLHLTNGEGEQTDYHYDDNGRLLLLRCGADSVHYQYDKVGRVRRIDTVDSCLQYRYDDLDRIVEERQGRQRITREYNDEQQTVTRHLWIDGKDQAISTTFHYNQVGELIRLDLPATDKQPHQLHFRYDQHGNETERTANQGFILKQRYNSMGLPLQQRAGYEPQHFFNRDELRATGIDSPSFAALNRTYAYDKALNTVAANDEQENLAMTVNGNNQITDISNRNHTRERYQYDSCGYLGQRQVGMPHGITLDPFDQNYPEQQLIDHNDIYQPGHKLHRLNNDRYVYDRAGRLIRKTTEEDGYRTGESHYRWNGFNQLTVFTGKGKLGERRYTWYYKYDDIGRRIEKACPEQNIKVRYVWDGDQLAYCETEKQQRIDSCRHSVFHGWELLAQQDQYYDIEQTAEGGQLNWKNQTHYAVCQSNGQPLALFTPEGKPAWRKQPTALWGRLLNHRWAKYQASEPLNPNLLFAGQYYDEESGLAYNRFRYYDPETANYLSSDPIGLNGGETPYSYVRNPWDWCDPWGLAGCLVSAGDGVTHDIQLALTKSQYKEAFGHIDDFVSGNIAGKSGNIFTIDRLGASSRRGDSLADFPTKKGFDRDEFPMAMFKEGGAGASVRYINPSDNRGAGSSIARALSGFADGTKVKIIVK